MLTASKSRHVGYEAWQERLDEQLPAACFRAQDREMAADLKRIIAEVMMFRPETEIRIGGQIFPARIVQEIYSKLNTEHVELVIDNFRAQTHEIKHIKTYLRTALYNAVFEINLRYTNMVAADHGGGT